MLNDGNDVTIRIPARDEPGRTRIREASLNMGEEQDNLILQTIVTYVLALGAFEPDQIWLVARPELPHLLRWELHYPEEHRQKDLIVTLNMDPNYVHLDEEIRAHRDYGEDVPPTLHRVEALEYMPCIRWIAYRLEGMGHQPIFMVDWPRSTGDFKKMRIFLKDMQCVSIAVTQQARGDEE